MPPGGAVEAGHMVLQLALDVAEESARPQAEPLRRKPQVAQLLLHEDEPVERLLRRAQAARRLESHRVARLLDKAGIKERAATNNPNKGEPGQKAKDRAEDKAAKAAEAAEAAAAAAAAPAVEEVAEEAVTEEAPAVEAAAEEAPAAEVAAAEEAPAEEAPAAEASEEQAEG